MNSPKTMLCELCEREVSTTSRHHLLPRAQGGRYSPTVNLCQPCHTTIHLTFTNKELARKYTSIEALRQAEGMQKYLEWISSRTIEKIPVRRKKENKKKRK